MSGFWETLAAPLVAEEPDSLAHPDFLIFFPAIEKN
jgi:hypothetical protein